MSVKLLDGPAAGVCLALRRAPLFLRVVQDKYANTDAGQREWDALDKTTDVPRPGETVYAYRQISHYGTAMVDGRDPKTGRRWGTCTQIATYRFIEQQPDQAALRDNARWREWVEQTHRAEQEAAQQNEERGPQ